MRAMSRKSYLACMALIFASCGSGGGGSTSGLDGSKKLDDLTHEEKGQFCDWAQNKLGGYETCDEELAFMGYPDKDACVHGRYLSSMSASCQPTVDQAETCVNSLRKCASKEDMRNSSACSAMTNC